MSILFIIPIIVDMHSHRFEVYSLESEIHKNVDLHPYSQKEKIILKPKEQKLVKVEAQFIDEISGLAIVKILDKLRQSIMMLKLKFTWNFAMLDIMNSSSEMVISNPKEMIGIIDLRSLGNYKIQQGVL